MALACDLHILITVINQLGRAVCFLRGNRGNKGWQISLAFLAPKRSAHPAYIDRNLIERHAQRFGDFMLHFCGMLG